MRIGQAGFTVRRLIAAVAIGLVVGIGTYELTGYWSGGVGGVFNGLCQPTIQAGFDPWTGLPHGVTWHCPPITESSNGVAADVRPQTTFVDPIPPEIASRRAVPLPLGFVLGAGIVLLVPRARRGVHSEQPNA